MKQSSLTIESVRKLNPEVTALVLMGDMSSVTAPGQFVNIAVKGKYLRRPISICDWDSEHLLLIFKEVGEGTKLLAESVPGDELDVLYPLGNGFSLDPANGDSDPALSAADIAAPVLVGGGIGIPPLYGLAKSLLSEGIRPKVVCGANTAEEVILADDFRQMGLETFVTTMDGSMGTKGLVTDALSQIEYDYIYACGPEPMLKALTALPADGQYSFEARMACGFGACMGCSCRTVTGYKRICKDGPVLRKEEILW